MLRVALVCLLVVGTSATAARTIEIRATCAADITPRDPAHVQTLRSELARALGRHPATSGYTLDVSLVRLDAAAASDEVEVRAEIRGMLSDEKGRIRVTSSAITTARGSAKDRELIQRDAIAAAAQRLGTTVRAQCCAK